VGAKNDNSDFNGFLPHIDVNAGLALLQGNKKLYVKLLKSFLASMSFSGIAEPLSERNLDKARETVHAFKGVSANLYLRSNFECSKELETVIKTQEDFSLALATLKTSAETTEQLINKLILILES
jgi:HPt (histidine-containing phosphotransfer) domain-containing protein